MPESGPDGYQDFLDNTALSNKPSDRNNRVCEKTASDGFIIYPDYTTSTSAYRLTPCTTSQLLSAGGQTVNREHFLGAKILS